MILDKKFLHNYIFIFNEYFYCLFIELLSRPKENPFIYLFIFLDDYNRELLGAGPVINVMSLQFKSLPH